MILEITFAMLEVITARVNNENNEAYFSEVTSAPTQKHVKI